MSVPLLLQFILCPIVLISLLAITAPYGRHHQAGWGPCLPARGAWFLMELPALLLLPYLVFSSPVSHVPAAWVPAAFWLLHYGYRTLLFPALMRTSGRTFPLLLAGFAVGFNLLNGFNNGTALVTNGFTGMRIESVRFIAGAVIFVAGFAVHCQADHVIRRLRKPGETAYRVPSGRLFRWVSSPQYLGEIVQWTGWAIMTWSLAGLAFALFTACNLVPRAVSNHRWYQARFPGYPGARKALIPRFF